MTKLWQLVYTNPIDSFTNLPPYPKTYISPDVKSRTWMSCTKPSYEQWTLFDGIYTKKNHYMIKFVLNRIILEHCMWHVRTLKIK